VSLTDTTAFPGALDTFADISAVGGDQLNTLGKEHDAHHDKLAKGLREAQRVTVGPTFVNLKGQGGVGNGFGNDSPAVLATMAAAPSGATMQAPAGEYMVDPDVLKLLVKQNIIGDGADTTWFTLRSDTAGAALALEVAGAGSVRGYYGTRIKGIGINLANAPSATGIRTGVLGGNGLTANWTHLDDVRVEGGAVSMDCQAVNVKLTNFHFINPTTSFLVIHPTGQEFRGFDGVLECSPGVAIAVAIDIPILVGGPAGAVYLRHVHLNNLGTVSRGIYAHCPNGSTASVPVRCTDVVLDNMAGPGYDLVNVTDALITAGWVNCAAGVDNGAIRFYGGGAHTVIGQQQLNGGFAGNASTFDFAGGSTAGVTLIGNNPSTGPYYRLPASGKPTDLLILDRIWNVAVASNISNDLPGLRAAMTKLWTPPRMIQEDVRFVGAAGQPAFENGWVNVGGQQAFFWMDSFGVVRLEGQVDSGTASTIFTLPPGYLPFQTASFLAGDGAGGSKLLNVNTDGTVTTLVPPGGIVSLAGVEFRT
jgi:hypothetical protein